MARNLDPPEKTRPKPKASETLLHRDEVFHGGAG